jgi:hypothetical protein
MENLPVYIPILFGITTLLTILIFYKATYEKEFVLYLLLGWIAIQGMVSYKLFYLDINAFPPHFLWLILPPLLVIVMLCTTPNGKRFIAALSPGYLTLLHIVRIPVEIVLYLLYVHAVVPKVMTFEGSNFDVLAGISAPVVFYFGYIKKVLNNKVLLAWNFICLGLLLNIVVTAILSAPFPFQQLGFEQPNKAILYFPFTWLPCCIVPLVLFAHIASIRKLLYPGTAHKPLGGNARKH